MVNLTRCLIVTVGLFVSWASPSRADRSGEKRLSETIAAMNSAQSIQVQFVKSSNNGGQVLKSRGKFASRRPNSFHFEALQELGQVTEYIHYDGSSVILWVTGTKHYDRITRESFMKLDGHDKRVLSLTTLFSRPEVLNQYSTLLGSPAIGKPIQILGVECQPLEFKKGPDYFRLYLGSESLPRGISSSIGGIITDTRFTSLSRNEGVPAAVAGWEPPTNVTEWKGD